MLSALLCCVAIFFSVSTALPSGAPASTCEDLIPRGPHANSPEQTSDNPWTIDICDFDEVRGYYTYTPGNTYNITLRPVQNAAVTLRGFVVQGRTQMDNVMVGSFADPSLLDDMTRLSNCDPPEVGVTHNNTNRTDLSGPFTFMWTAPAAGTGPIWFRYTIVEEVEMWWADDSSAIVQEVDNLVFPSGAPKLQGLGLGTLLFAAVSIAIKAMF